MSVYPSRRRRYSQRRPAPFFLLLGLLAGLFLVATPATWANEPTKYLFDLPAETADRALKRFSEQSGLEVLFPTRVARRVRTHSVKGELEPREALTRMLQGSGLIIIEDQRAKAFSIKPEDPEKNGKRAARPMISDRPMIPTFPTQNEIPQ